MTVEKQSQLKALIARGKEKGYLTYAEVNDHLPDDIVDPEQIEDIVNMIADMGITVHEEAPDEDQLMMADNPVTDDEDDDEAAEEAAATLAALDSELGRTTDPVRMYMREMGTVELLTREGEIAIAKRIEEGLNAVQTALASFPWSIQLLIEEYDQHLEGKRMEAVAGEDRRGLVKGAVDGRLAAAQIVIVHRGQIVMDQRIDMDALDRDRGA